MITDRQTDFPDSKTDTKADTRDRLILVAIKMFAEQGFSGVSMRTINSAAGSKNSSAVHYHFGNKMGIVEAVIKKLHDEVNPLFDRILGDLEKKLDRQQLSVEDVIVAMLLPFWVLYCTPDYGRYSAKLSARLMQESDEEVKALYGQYLEEPIGRLFALMRVLQPEKEELHLRFQMMKCFVSAISGIATLDYMGQTPLGDIRFNDPVDMMNHYTLHVAYGLSQPSLDVESSKMDIEFWSRYRPYFSMRPDVSVTRSLEVYE